jgi:hypothetical protein
MLSVVLLAVDAPALPVLRALDTPLLVRVDTALGSRPAFKPVLAGLATLRRCRYAVVIR